MLSSESKCIIWNMRIRTKSVFFLLGTLAGIFFYGGKIPEAPNKTASPITSQIQSVQTIETYGNYPVIRVVDGDTIIVRINNKEERIRLIGLDTPETVDPRKPVECFGKEASDEAKKILTGKIVHLETDSSQGSRDSYGRLLAYVILPDGTNFNEFMIAEGYGYEYTYKIPYKYQTEFKKAEKIAHENKKGLWADGVCIQ